MPRGIYNRHEARDRREIQSPVLSQPASVAAPENESDAAATPVRLLTAFGYYDDQGERRTWCEGEVVCDPETIATLRHHGATLVEAHGDISGLNPAYMPRDPEAPCPVTSPLCMTAPYEFYDPTGAKRFWVAGEYVSDPQTAAMLRGLRVSYKDAE